MKRLSRRTFLRGTVAGTTVALGLPVLDAMLNTNGTAHADGEAFPQRFVQWFWGNGLMPGGWAPATTGLGWEPTPMLRGLDALKDRISLVSGTRLPVRGANNPHVEGVCGILSGGNPVLHPTYSGSRDWNYMTVPRESLDHSITQLVGPTSYPSLVLGVTTPHGTGGQPGTAVSYISHSGQYTPNRPELDPTVAFASLFGMGLPEPGLDEPSQHELARARLLDSVLEEANALDRRLGAGDRIRLEQHMDSVRDLQERLLLVTEGRLGEACMLPDTAPTNPASYRARANAMSEIINLAFACDLTRVAVMEFSSPASHASYPDVGISGTFHERQHTEGFTSLIQSGLTYFVEIFGDHLMRMSNTPDGEGSMLDHSLVFGTSELADGNAHGFDDFPLILAGGACGHHNEGQHVRLEGELSTRMPLTILRAMGSDVTSWGQEQFTTSAVIDELLHDV